MSSKSYCVVNGPYGLYTSLGYGVYRGKFALGSALVSSRLTGLGYTANVFRG